MVHDATNNFSYNRDIFFSRVLILSNSMAFALCSSHQAQRFVTLPYVRTAYNKSVMQVSLRMKLTRTRLFLDGSCRLSGRLSLLFFRLLVWMLLWYAVAPTILPVTLIGSNIAAKLLQNVILPLFGLFYIRYNYPYAIELEGMISLDL